MSYSSIHAHSYSSIHTRIATHPSQRFIVISSDQPGLHSEPLTKPQSARQHQTSTAAPQPTDGIPACPSAALPVACTSPAGRCDACERLAWAGPFGTAQRIMASASRIRIAEHGHDGMLYLTCRRHAASACPSMLKAMSMVMCRGMMLVCASLLLTPSCDEMAAARTWMIRDPVESGPQHSVCDCTDFIRDEGDLICVEPRRWLSRLDGHKRSSRWPS